MNASVRRLWSAYRAANPGASAAPPLACHFCDNRADADECAALVLAGKKRATATALAELEMAGDPVPKAGDLAVVTDWSGAALAVIRTTGAHICRFGDVDSAFARDEGEGDLTLDWWRRAHRAYYGRALAGSGHEVDDDLEIVCERFEVIFTGGGARMNGADTGGICIRPAEGPDDRRFMDSLNERLSAAIRAPAHTPREVAAFQERFTAASLDDTGGGSATLIAHDGAGARLGYVHVTEGTDDVTGNPCAYIALLAVTAAAEGGGTGDMLLRHAERWARDAGHERIALDVFASNARARRFYERRDFGEETIRLAKRLDARSPRPIGPGDDPGHSQS